MSDKETLASVSSVENTENKTFEPSDNQTSEIDELTNEKRVITYVKQHKELPDYYITKSEAREGGWVASEGNLCDVLPGKAIGGDRFSNREKQLPAGQQYYEADVNYNCGRRGADRIVFTKDGEVWLTHNHYKTFEKQ
ncbi:MAG: ribonuclease domain-containing protein [Bergeyella zoohelcum]|nr:ribonuclease domain-containing protein [Bergeyella zoohelcum]